MIGTLTNSKHGVALASVVMMLGGCLQQTHVLCHWLDCKASPLLRIELDHPPCVACCHGPTTDLPNDPQDGLGAQKEPSPQKGPPCENMPGNGDCWCCQPPPPNVPADTKAELMARLSTALTMVAGIATADDEFVVSQFGVDHSVPVALSSVQRSRNSAVFSLDWPFAPVILVGAASRPRQGPRISPFSRSQFFFAAKIGD